MQHEKQWQRDVLEATSYLMCMCAGKEAETLGKELGVHVLRHESKKPDGGIAEVEQYFGCVCAYVTCLAVAA